MATVFVGSAPVQDFLHAGHAMTGDMLNRDRYGYLIPQINAFFPLDADDFRQLYGANPFPAYRAEGLASMADGEIEQLATTLRLAAIEKPSAITSLWAAVIEQGRRVSEGGTQ